jgi:hypothetical protein
VNNADSPAGIYALLADGTTIEIRPGAVTDFDAVWHMYRAMSPDNIYLRFFSMSGAAAQEQAGGSAGSHRLIMPPASRGWAGS